MFLETSLSDLIANRPLVLAEFAITERLRRMPGVELHPTLYNTPLIYGPEASREALSSLYREYLETAAAASLPLLLTAPTWRLDRDRITSAGVPQSINTDAVAYLRQLRDAHGTPARVGALTGPRHDCYRPELAPDAAAAEAFHRWQVEQLAASCAEFLLAQTLPAVDEALGMARAMAATDIPYFISFCTGTDGRVLDGTPLPEAMARIDDGVERAPLGYFVNCTHPSFLTAAHASGQLERLIGIQANASSKDVTRLDGSAATVADAIDDWTQAMADLHETHSVPVLGGCCGTGLAHMQALIAALA
jgi:S-methylmethionine-dependent homocysteine/selenocysteine methylase